MRHLLVWATLVAVCLSAGAVQAQTAAKYPAKPVRIVVGFAPGGGADIVARIVAQKLTDAFGQSFVVDNRPGASATIATEFAARAAPDGYTLSLGVPTSHSVLPSLWRGRLNYDPLQDFAPVTMLGTSPLLLAVHPSLPVKTVRDLIAVARARPGQLTFGAGGIGTPPHMAGELFKQTAGVDMLLVAYKGEAPAITDLLGGQISLIFSNVTAVLPHVRANKLRGIAVTALERVPTAPELPTVAASGLPGFEIESWYGLLAPARTPHEIVMRLHDETVRMLNQPDAKQRIEALGLVVKTTTPEQLATYMQEQVAKWAKVVKASGAKAD
jgi:tripartite-type tricarboxylate transporter receptor subunit TctC